jgi:hypothetical protein
VAKEPSKIESYEAWLREFVRLAETGRKRAAELRELARGQGRKLQEQRFSSHAQRLYNEEVYWTLQIEGVASAAAAERALSPAPAKPAAKAPAKRPARAKSATR